MLKIHKYVKTTFTREGILYLAALVVLFLGATLREVNLLLLLASILCCPVFLAWRLGRRTLRDLDVRRSVPSHLHAGDVFVITLTLWNKRKKLPSWAMIVEDSLRLINGSPENRKETRTIRPAVYFEHLPPNEQRKKTYSGILPQRGRYTFGPLTLSTRFPAGLFHIRLQENGAKEKVVLTLFPRLGKIDARWTARTHEAVESRHRRRFRASRVSGEFLGLRNWRHGDMLRRIHWRASARHGTLVVRQFEQHQNHDAVILLDLFEAETPGPVERENIELAVSFAATLVSEMARQEAAGLTLGLYDPLPELISGPNCSPLIDTMFERLAVQEPSRNDNLAELLRQVILNSPPKGDIFLVTTRPLDLLNSDRLTVLKSDPKLRQLASRIRIVDTSDEKLGEFFTL